MGSIERFGGRPDAMIERETSDRETSEEIFDEKIGNVWESLRPRPEQFVDSFKQPTGVYPAEAVFKDKQWVEAARRGHDQKPESSRELEMCFIEGVYEHGWLGEDVEVIPASNYDDYANGVDVILVIGRGEGAKPLLLGVDVTTSDDITVDDQKIHRNIRVLNGTWRKRKLHGRTEAETAAAGYQDPNYMTEVNYFPGANEIDPGTVRLPTVVVGTDWKNSKDLYGSFVRSLREEPTESLDRHTIQYELIRQIQRQLTLGLQTSIETAVRKGVISTSERQLVKNLTHVHDLELSDQLTSPEWESCLTTVLELRGQIEQKSPKLAEAIFSQIDLLQWLAEVEQEKRSHSVNTAGAQNQTEALLEIPAKRKFTQPLTLPRAA